MTSSDNTTVTLSEFAKKVGVSTATISSVFNGKNKERGISDKTTDFVRTQAAKFGYQPNIAAKRLRAQKEFRTYELAVFTSYEAPFQISSNLVHMLEATAQSLYGKMKFCVEIIMFHAGRISEVPGILDGSRFNGAIITNTSAADDQFFMENKSPCPVVFLGREIPGYSSVSVDAYEMGSMAAEELLDRCGCTQVSVVAPVAEWLTQSTKGRVEGFVERCRQAQVSCHVMETQGLNESAGCEAIGQYLDLHGKSLNGIYFVSDLLAVGGYHAMAQRGLTIPDDIAVVGIGDISVGRFMNPPLTVFNEDYSDKQDAYVSRMLLDKLFKKNVSLSSRVFHPSIVRRGSTLKNSEGLRV
jgi:LacI family transcriptional regulator